MVNITLSIPEEVKTDMDEFVEINWSAVAREAIKRKIMVLKQMNDILKDSKLTEKDVLEFGAKIKSKATKRFLNGNRS